MNEDMKRCRQVILNVKVANHAPKVFRNEGKYDGTISSKLMSEEHAWMSKFWIGGVLGLLYHEDD